MARQSTVKRAVTVLVALLATATLPVAVVANDGRGARGAVCGRGTLEGPYAFRGVGEVLGAPFALIGRVDFTRDGLVTGALSETRLLVGDVEHTTLEGSYSFDATCQGEMTFRVQHDGYVDNHSFDLVVAGGGNRLFWMLTATWFEHLDVAADGPSVGLDPLGVQPTIGGSSDRHAGVLSGTAERMEQ